MLCQKPALVTGRSPLVVGAAPWASLWVVSPTLQHSPRPSTLRSSLDLFVCWVHPSCLCFIMILNVRVHWKHFKHQNISTLTLNDGQASVCWNHECGLFLHSFQRECCEWSASAGACLKGETCIILPNLHTALRHPLMFTAQQKNVPLFRNAALNVRTQMIYELMFQFQNENTLFRMMI